MWNDESPYKRFFLYWRSYDTTEQIVMCECDCMLWAPWGHTQASRVIIEQDRLTQPASSIFSCKSLWTNWIDCVICLPHCLHTCSGFISLSFIMSFCIRLIYFINRENNNNVNLLLIFGFKLLITDPSLELLLVVFERFQNMRSSVGQKIEHFVYLLAIMKLKKPSDLIILIFVMYSYKNNLVVK